MDESEVYGRILDHEFNPKERAQVDIYHVAFTLPPVILPLRYFLGTSTTNMDGRFRIAFPTEAYEVIDQFRTPNIELKISESYHLLHTHQVGFCTCQNSIYNLGDIIIPAKFVYSDKLNHMNYLDILETYLPDIAEFPMEEMPRMRRAMDETITGDNAIPERTNFIDKKAHINKVIPQYTEFMQNENRFVEGPELKNYRGTMVTKRPKKFEHRPHKIPWYPDWSQ